MQRRTPPLPIYDTVTEQLPGERWKTIPGYEGLYQLSDHGRVRSLSRWVYSENRPDAFRPGRIKKPSIGQRDQVTIQLHHEGVRRLHSVARLVYYLFVRKFDLNDHTVMVTRKDGNGLHCHYTNLVLTTISNVAKAGFAAHTRGSSFFDQMQPVHQYSSKGQFMCSFAHNPAAEAATGVDAGYISDAARSQGRTAGGFYWRYGKAKPRIPVKQYQERLAFSMRVKRKSVLQLSMSGKILRRFPSVRAAADAVRLVSTTSISHVCSGKRESTKGFRWRYASD